MSVEDIAKVIRLDNPPPMKLKFKKVFLPCILLTKKRYAGYMYETRDQVKPVYDAKGIKTFTPPAWTPCWPSVSR